MKNRHPIIAQNDRFAANQHGRRDIQLDSVSKKRRKTSMKCRKRIFVIVLFFAFSTLSYVSFRLLNATEGRYSGVPVSVSDPLPPATSTGQRSEAKAPPPLHPKYVTVVLPSVVNPDGRAMRLKAIDETWGPTANAIYVVHPGKEYTLTTTTSSTFPQTLLVPEEKATEEQGVPRLQYVIEQIHRTHNPDFAFFVNDHTYVIPQHACEFLEGRDPEEHLYAGHAMRPGNADFAFNSGASGYFLSRETMAFLTEKWSTGDDVCLGNNARNKKWLQGNPGLLTAQCLHASLGLDPIDSRDELKRHKFHAFGVIRVVKNEVDEWYQKRHKDLGGILGEDVLYNHQLQQGEDCCSGASISFHYVEWKETSALTNIFGALLNDPNMDDGALRQMIEQEWPKEKKDVGGYAHNLPPKGRKQVWNDLVKVIRNISPHTSRSKCF